VGVLFVFILTGLIGVYWWDKSYSYGSALSILIKLFALLFMVLCGVALKFLIFEYTEKR